MNKMWMLLSLGELTIHNHLNTVEAPDDAEKPGRDTKAEPMESGASPWPLHRTEAEDQRFWLCTLVQPSGNSLISDQDTRSRPARQLVGPKSV